MKIKLLSLVMVITFSIGQLQAFSTYNMRKDIVASKDYIKFNRKKRKYYLKIQGEEAAIKECILDEYKRISVKPRPPKSAYTHKRNLEYWRRYHLYKHTGATRLDMCIEYAYEKTRCERSHDNSIECDGTWYVREGLGANAHSEETAIHHDDSDSGLANKDSINDALDMAGSQSE